MSDRLDALFKQMHGLAWTDGPDRLPMLLGVAVRLDGRRLPDSHREAVAAFYAPEDREDALAAIDVAVEFYYFEKAVGVGWEGEARDKRALKAQAKHIEDWAKPLRQWLKLRLSDEERARIGLPLGGYELDDRIVEAVRHARRAIVELLAVSDSDAPVVKGPAPKISDRRLAQRLEMIWRTLKAGGLAQPISGDRDDPLRPWPWRDFVKAVMNPVTGSTGAGFAKELAYPTGD